MVSSMSISMARGRWVIVSRPFCFQCCRPRQPRPICREYQIPRTGSIPVNDVAGPWMPGDVEIRSGDFAGVLVLFFVILFFVVFFVVFLIFLFVIRRIGLGEIGR